jgi:hypothetical protein
LATGSAGSAIDGLPWHSGRVPSVEILGETVIVDRELAGLRGHRLASKSTVWPLTDEPESGA